MSAPGEPDGDARARALAAALAGRGIDARVEPSDRLAILVPLDGTSPDWSAAVRAEVVAAAREHGFTHVAVEIGA